MPEWFALRNISLLVSTMTIEFRFAAYISIGFFFFQAHNISRPKSPKIWIYLLWRIIAVTISLEYMVRTLLFPYVQMKKKNDGGQWKWTLESQVPFFQPHMIVPLQYMCITWDYLFWISSIFRTSLFHLLIMHMYQHLIHNWNSIPIPK